MKRINRIACAFLGITLLITTIGFTKEVSATDVARPKEVDVVFSTDLHSYLSAYDVEKDGKIVSIGGAPRISTFISQMREEHPDLLLLDGGDYPMGTLYQTLFDKEAFEYRMLSYLGYDAIVFGNHDFDYGADCLASQFEVAKEKCDYYPEFLICNVNWDNQNNYTRTVYDSLKDMNLKEYVIIEKNGVRIGLTGVIGYDAIDCAPTCEFEFIDPVEAVKTTVAKMKAEENPDIVILISHSGTSDTGEKSEDEIIAKAVPDIDFIVSAHSHRFLPENLKVGNTYIAVPGCYGEYMGYAKLIQNSSGRYDLAEYEMVPMDESIEEDPEVKQIVEEYDEIIDSEFLSTYGYTQDQVIAKNDYKFSTVDDVYFIHDDHNLGNLIADAYRWRVSTMDTGDDNPVMASTSPSGTIRATYPVGDITVGKVYESFSLGMGLDGTVGYPLVDVYLTGEELSTLCEIDATLSEIMHSANLYMSGLEFTFNKNRVILNKVTDVKFRTGFDNSAYEEIEPDKLYRVVTDLYSYRMLGSVESTSKGLLTLVPKTKDGKPIENESEAVIHDKDGNEVKAWIAIAEYMQSMDEDGDGIGTISSLYDGTDDRKIVSTSHSISELVKKPNKFFFIIIGAVLIVVLIIVLIVLLIIKLIKLIIKAVKKCKDKKQ